MSPADVATVRTIASALLNARGMRRGSPIIVNVLDIVPRQIREDAIADADYILTELRTADASKK